MSNAQFRRDFAKIIERTKEKAETVVRRAALDLFSSMVERSPVDTGRFRGNWQVGIGSVNTNTTSGDDKSGTDAQARAGRVVQSVKIGQTIFLTQSLPYARRIEYGWSQQAPGGVVRLTVLEYQSFIRRAAAALN